MFAVRLYELMQIVLSSVVDDQDITRVEELGAWLLAKVPVVFPDFGNKPKFHYGLAHIGLSLRRHGPTPYWSSFAFESRLGELKRACLLVSNNHGVAHRGASLALEMSLLGLVGGHHVVSSALPLFDWAVQKGGSVAMLRTALDEEPVLLSDTVEDVVRFEGTASAFSRGSVIVSFDFRSNPLLSGECLYEVHRMCRLQSTCIYICSISNAGCARTCRGQACIASHCFMLLRVIMS